MIVVINLWCKLRTGMECFGVPWFAQSGVHGHLSVLVIVSALLLNENEKLGL